MNHNPDNLKEGEHVILDKGFANSSEVIIWKFSSNEMFATVYVESKTEDKWDVMTIRLSKLKD